MHSSTPSIILSYAGEPWVYVSRKIRALSTISVIWLYHTGEQGKFPRMNKDTALLKIDKTLLFWNIYLGSSTSLWKALTSYCSKACSSQCGSSYISLCCMRIEYRICSQPSCRLAAMRLWDWASSIDGMLSWSVSCESSLTCFERRKCICFVFN